MNAKATYFALAAVALLVIGYLAGMLPPEATIIGAAFGTLYTEGIRASDWLKWEEDQRHSREEALVLSGQNLVSGAVIGKSLVGAAGAATAFAGNTGNGAMGAITVTGAAKRGIYKLIVTEPAANAGAFVVEDPTGKVIGKGNVAAAFSAGGLAFTLADGAADFVAGDGFDIAVTGGSYKWKEYDPSLTDGAQFAAGILLDAVDASAADTKGVAIIRQAIVGKEKLTWKAGTTADQKQSAYDALEAVGISVRAQV
jgi:hypothetical protein